jgi:hypothetical protein
MKSKEVQVSKLTQNIIDKYESVGYKLVSINGEELKFSNLFSRHFVFIISDYKELKQKWEKFQTQVIDEYLEFKDEAFLEWNFYCVYILKNKTKSEQERNYILNIEQDRSYSRKYVLSKSELNFLPPGRIAKDAFTTKGAFPTDISEKWETDLGKELFDAITYKPKNKIETRLLIFLENKIEYE